MGPKPPKNQHCVSQVLSGRWAQDGPLHVRDLVAGTSFEVGTVAFGAIQDYISFEPVAAEARWQAMEKTASSAFEAVDAGVIFEESDRRSDLLAVFSLHFARSQVATQIYERSTAATVAAARTMEDYEPGALERVFEQTTGRPAAGDDDLIWAANLIADGVERHLTTGQFFRDRVYSLVDRAMARLSSSRIHICRAVGADEFIIGDTPCVPADVENDRVGVLDGVGIEVADTFLMPLGPRTVMALAEGDGAADLYMDIDDRAVQKVNRIQIRAARRQIAGRTRATVDAAVHAWRV